MKLSFTNLAWDKKDENKILSFLKKNRIDFIEYSTFKLYKNKKSNLQLARIKKKYKNKGIKLYSMQSLLFNIKNAYIFGAKDQRKTFENEIIKKIKIAKKLGTKRLIFGSPLNKKKFGKSNKDCDEIMIKFLKKISKFCMSNKVVFCLEANPKVYNCEYLTNTMHAIKLVKRVDNPWIKINFDLGTAIMNNESFKKIITNNIDFIGHIQISAPKLKGIIKIKTKALNFLKFLKKQNFKNKITIEMLPYKKNNFIKLKYIFNYLKKV